ncbi:hypothetical protein EIN_153750 [Entamoeba invadens IP1]|uniref:Gamma-secretase subunit PEN-2 n=1 Tax=Entamoeba invadens IP1 TaxID=370355 RepID=A0A0A1UCC1_ENTIV|nr:hypothetical protein EIN_153750 [Entamoeba invadens IP1]ELP91338.1 hypothetical protein EIN_153750 [Entamoeba invadens IP1]|eukprot:XP_004258109.1 hypothetical protein EIN_153750 [Entamoeba invadens IP1]
MFFDPEELDNKKSRKICKVLFITGFAMMPACWVILIWFCFYFVKPTTVYRNRYILLGCTLIFVETLILFVWNLIYQNSWMKWGAVGDYLDVISFKGQL